MQDRLPPHSVEAEQGILGSVFLSPQESMSECIEKLPTADVFYDLRHRRIYEAMVAMYDNGIAIDTITVGQRLRDAKELDAVGGGAFLSSLPDKVPSAANLGFYLDVVREKYVLRRILRVCTGVTHSVYEHEGEVDGLLDAVERDILGVADLMDSGKGIAATKALVLEALSAIEGLHEKKGATLGLATGFMDFDRMTNGLMAGEMIVIAARPSIGKTSLAMNIAEHCVGRGVPVGVFSLEMTARSLIMRMLCSASSVNLRDVQAGFMVEKDFKNLALRSSHMAKAPLYIDDSSGISILQLRAKARRMHQKHGIKLLIVDYLQLLRSTNKRADNRQQEIADISGGLKGLAKELDIPVIVVSQLNRALEKENRKPQLSDLRESGAIEQDADLVAMLYRQKQEDDVGIGDVIQVGLVVAKQRNGPTGEVNLIFRPAITRFESAAKI